MNLDTLQREWDMIVVGAGAQILANGLFVNGAGAAVLGPGDKEVDGWHLVDTTSRLARSANDAMTWKVGDHGFEMTLSSDVPKLVRGSARV